MYDADVVEDEAQHDDDRSDVSEARHGCELLRSSLQRERRYEYVRRAVCEGFIMYCVAVGASVV